MRFKTNKSGSSIKESFFCLAKKKRYWGAVFILFVMVFTYVCGVYANDLKHFTRQDNLSYDPLPYSAETNSFDFKHITDQEGLSHDTVYSIAQDKDGFMWFGTEDGLDKYDGYTIKAYQREAFNKNSLQCANCSAIFVDDSNLIWIASWGGGVEVFDPRSEKITSYVNNPADANSISDNNVQSIFQDSKGKYWFGTYTKGLNQFDPKTGKFKVYMHDENNPNSLTSNRVWSINEDNNGALLIGTNEGLDKLDPFTGKITHYNNAVNDRVRVIYRDKSNRLWLGTQNGLCLFDTSTGTNKYFFSSSDDPSTNTITSIFEDSRGVLWVGTANGLNILNRNTGEFIRYENNQNDPNSISNNDIRAICEDLSGNVWICTRGGGVNKVDIKPKKFGYFTNTENDSQSLSNNFVLSIFQDSLGAVWVGTKKGGLNKLDLNTKQFSYYMNEYTKDENRDLASICEDSADSIWVGSLGGLNRFNKNTEKYFTYKNNPDDAGSISSNTILSVFRDHLGTIWVGTLDGGLNQYNAESDTFIRYTNDANNPHSLSDNTVNSIYEDKQGLLWIATQNGLNRFDKATKKFSRYSLIKDNPNSISDNQINCIYEDSRNNLWLGTQSGLNKFDKRNNTFTLYTMKEGLPNNVIHSIVEDHQGRLWLTTNHGISLFNVDKRTFKNYDSLDGLQGNGYNDMAFAKTINGEIFFGGINGLDYFNPRDVKDNTFVSPIVITSCKVMDKPMELSKLFESSHTLNLTHKDLMLAIEFSSLDYTRPEKNQYAYKLEGFDKDWNYTGTRRYLSYTNLPSGNYKLLLKGTNCDGAWNEASIPISIKIAPPPWKTWWAYGIYTIILLGLIYLYTRYSLNKRERKLEGQIQSMIMLLSSTLDINEVLQKFMDSFMKIIPYDKAVVILKEDDEFKVTAALGYVDAQKTEHIMEEEQTQSIIKRIEETKLPYILKSDLSWLSIPIIYNSNIEGIVILQRDSSNSFGSMESSTGFLFASQAGFALKNASLYAELKLALESIQAAQEQLIQSEKMAALGQLVAGIAHEINNPLGAIRASVTNIAEYLKQFTNYIEVFKRLDGEQLGALNVLISRKSEMTGPYSTAEARKYRRKLSQELEDCGIEDADTLADMLVDIGIKEDIEPFMPILQSEQGESILQSAYSISGLYRNSLNIRLAVERASKIVYALKNYSRNGQGEPFVKANVIEGIETVLSIYHNQIRQNIELIKNYSQIPEIICSPDELNQVWTNIIYNGLQAMDYKGVLAIDVFQEAQHIVVKITDNGKGIPEEIRDRIFQPFFTTKPQGEGTGLGLHIVKGIIDKHKGEISMESEPGRTSFTITLPIEVNC